MRAASEVVPHPISRALARQNRLLLRAAAAAWLKPPASSDRTDHIDRSRCRLPVDLQARTGALDIRAVIHVVASQEAARDGRLAVVEHDARIVVEPPVDAQLPGLLLAACRARHDRLGIVRQVENVVSRKQLPGAASTLEDGVEDLLARKLAKLVGARLAGDEPACFDVVAPIGGVVAGETLVDVGLQLTVLTLYRPRPPDVRRFEAIKRIPIEESPASPRSGSPDAGRRRVPHR